MEDIRLGATIRALRIRRKWRQQDLADAAGVSRATIWRIERGHLGSLSLDSTRAVCSSLEIRLDLVPRWRGGELDRVLGGRHSGLSESVVRWLSRVHPTWEVVPEVSFNVWGERGIIDLVLWHPEHRALAVVELKTQLVDINELLGTLDRKRRLAAPAVRDRGWRPAIVAAWIIVADTRTNHRRVADHRTMLRSAYPADGRAMRTWLRDPYGPIAVLSMWAAG